MNDARGGIGDRVALRFAALGEPTRLRLVRELARREEAAVQELAAAVGAPIPNISKHLNVLYNAELVERRREGTRVLYRLGHPAVWRICEDMEAVVCAAAVASGVGDVYDGAAELRVGRFR